MYYLFLFVQELLVISNKPIKDNKKQIDNKKQLDNNKLLLSKEREIFKNIYDKRLNKVDELYKKN